MLVHLYMKRQYVEYCWKFQQWREAKNNENIDSFASLVEQ